VAAARAGAAYAGETDPYRKPREEDPLDDDETVDSGVDVAPGDDGQR
jgi:ribosome-binding factor A